MVEALIKAGANVEAASDAGAPLLWAAGSGAMEVGTANMSMMRKHDIFKFM